MPADVRHLRRHALETAELDLAGAHVGVGVDPEGHDPARKPCGPFQDARVVGIRDEHVRAVGRLENLGLGVGDRLGGGEEAQVGIADVGPHPHFRLGDTDERPDLAGVIHPELDDGDLGTGAELKK